MSLRRFKKAIKKMHQLEAHSSLLADKAATDTNDVGDDVREIMANTALITSRFMKHLYVSSRKIARRLNHKDKLLALEYSASCW